MSCFTLMKEGSEFQQAARATILAKIPFRVYGTFLMVLWRHPRAMFAKCWKESYNLEMFIDYVLKFWPEQITDDGTNVLVSGSKLFHRIIIVFIDMMKAGRENQFGQMKLVDVDEAVLESTFRLHECAPQD